MRDFVAALRRLASPRAISRLSGGIAALFLLLNIHRRELAFACERSTTKAPHFRATLVC